MSHADVPRPTGRAATRVEDIETVDGPIDPDEAGFTLPHEHLIVQGWDHHERNYPNSASMELAKYAEIDGRTLVDVSSVGMPRDPEFARALAHRAGINVVLGTGFYKGPWLPAWAHTMSVEDMTALIVRELGVGIEDTSIRAGIIGEIGVSLRMQEVEFRSVAAAGRAQQATRRPISLHFEVGAAADLYERVLDLLEDEGADLRRVAVGHIVARPDNVELCQMLAGRGCYVEFDLFGQERRGYTNDMISTHPEVQMSSIKGFVDLGLLPNILLSQDVRHVELLTVNGGDGYALVGRIVLPKLLEYGVTANQIHEMTHLNPRKLLATPRPDRPGFNVALDEVDVVTGWPAEITASNRAAE